jgi:phage-related holin
MNILLILPAFVCMLTRFDTKESIVQLLHFFETYVFADWQFLTFFLTLQVIDTFLLFYKAIVTKAVSARLFGIVCQKIFIYVCFLVLVHILANYTIDGQRNSFFGWFTAVAYSAVMVRESISILENIGSIRPDLVPPRILKWLKQYDKTGNFEAKETKKTAK